MKEEQGMQTKTDKKMKERGNDRQTESKIKVRNREGSEKG